MPYHINSGSFKKGIIPWIKGKKHTEESKQKMRETLKGRKVWNKGKKWDKTIIEKISKAKKGSIPWNKGTKGLQVSHNKGKIMSEEIRKKQSGKNCHWWKGGITKENELIRKKREFRLWREAVFARDNWTCQKCNVKSGNGTAIYLHPHHIQNFAEFTELRFAIDNGQTFCENCHKEFHKIYGFRNNTKEQLQDFLIL